MPDRNLDRKMKLLTNKKLSNAKMRKMKAMTQTQQDAYMNIAIIAYIRKTRI